MCSSCRHGDCVCAVGELIHPALPGRHGYVALAKTTVSLFVSVLAVRIACVVWTSHCACFPAMRERDRALSVMLCYLPTDTECSVITTCYNPETLLILLSRLPLVCAPAHAWLCPAQSIHTQSLLVLCGCYCGAGVLYGE